MLFFETSSEAEFLKFTENTQKRKKMSQIRKTFLWLERSVFPQ